MTLYLSQKKLLFLLLGAFLLGAVFALFYDLLRTLRSDRKPKRLFGRILSAIGLNLSDFLSFGLLGVADAILLFVYHSGRVRISVFFMNLLGFLLYRVTVSRTVMAVLRHIKNAVCYPFLAVARTAYKLRKRYEKKGVFLDHHADGCNGGDRDDHLDTDRPEGTGGKSQTA